MSEYEIAMVIITTTLIIISVLYIVSILIECRKVAELEMDLHLTKSKYFELEHKIFYLEKRIEKLEPKDEAKPKIVKLPTTDDGLKDYIPPNNQTPSNDPIMSKWTTINEQINDKVLRQALASRMNYTTWLTIKECINLLSTDGKGTKQQVKEKLEELIKDAKD